MAGYLAVYYCYIPLAALRARPSRSKLLLEWDASPVNDMLADSIVALAAQAQTRYVCLNIRRIQIYFVPRFRLSPSPLPCRR